MGVGALSFAAKAVLFPQPNLVEVREVAVPDPSPLEVLVQAAYSGVSQGTERWLLKGIYNKWGQDVPRYYPCSPGYQVAGIIEKVGASVVDLHPGDPVRLDGTRFTDLTIKQAGPAMGAHSSRLVAAAADVTKLGSEDMLLSAALFRMASVARHGVRLTQIHAGEMAVVIGLGMIGQMAAQAARENGARVIGTDLVQLRLSLGAKYSVDSVIDSSIDDIRSKVLDAAADGADVVIDTTGNSQIFDLCRDLVRYEGRIALQGVYPDPIVIEHHPTHLKRVTLTFPCGWDTSDDQALARDISEGVFQISPLITHQVPYRDASAAYDLLLRHPERTLGMVIDWRTA
jgi:bacteriochlorophyllide a dehydrogenase